MLLEKDTHPSGYAGECLLFQGASREAREASAFPPAPVGDSLRGCGARVLRKMSNAKIAKKHREGREENLSLASAARVCPWATEVGNPFQL
jgi:hypothetical protein